MYTSQHSLEQPRKGWLATALTGLRTREGDRKGFTLIELIVVIIIIAILAAIAIPIFLNQRATAHRSALESDVKNSVNEVMNATGNRPDFTGAPVVETAASGNTVVAANHPVDPASFMIYGYSEGAGGIEICFDSSTSAMGEHACAQPNLARVAAESGTPGGTNPGDDEGTPGGGDDEGTPGDGGSSEGREYDAVCYDSGGYNAYNLGYSEASFGVADFDAFVSQYGMTLEDWGFPGCQSEWQLGFDDYHAGNPYNAADGSSDPYGRW